MKISNRDLLWVLVLFMAIFGCTADNKEEVNIQIIPHPVEIEAVGKFFVLDNKVSLEGDLDYTGVGQVIAGFNYWLSGATNIEIQKRVGSKKKFSLEQTEDIQVQEGYAIEVMGDEIKVKFLSASGLFYALQTIRQLLPVNFENDLAEKINSVHIPGVIIRDYPAYEYRGMHLDVGRHMFPVETIKKYIDLLAMHKMNRFHWHLTEDQGWRIEIKKYPKLQEISAYRDETLVGHFSDQPHQFDGIRYGGYYTQDEIRDIVKYAQDRMITIIPEIELPGHSQAVLAAYPEFGCTGKTVEVSKIWGIRENVFCPKEETFQFLQDVLTEVMDLFPSKLIHIGGDECPKTQWEQSAFCQQLIKKEGLKDEHELQSYFIQRIEKFVNSHGRNIIGWDEILEGGLAPNAAVMSWRGTEGGIAAAKMEHPVVMTPNSHCYFDHYQSKDSGEPLAIGGFLPVEKVYSYHPTPEDLAPEFQKYIIGAQGNVWTEYIKTPEHLEYMAFPRAIALSEVVWTPVGQRDYKDFSLRLSNHFNRLDELNVNYANHLFSVDYKLSNDEKGLALSLSSIATHGDLFYTLDGTSPTNHSTKYENPILLNQDTEIRAIVYSGEKPISKVKDIPVFVHKAVGRELNLINDPHPNYNLGGSQALLNGLKANSVQYNDGEWLGWNGSDFIADIKMDSTPFDKINLRFFKGIGEWIHLPSMVKIHLSEDGENYQLKSEIPIDNTKSGQPFKNIGISMPGTITNFIRIEATNHGIIADGLPGAGNPAWLFVDEIVIE